MGIYFELANESVKLLEFLDHYSALTKPCFRCHVPTVPFISSLQPLFLTDARQPFCYHAW